jgi:hypothetical protein
MAQTKNIGKGVVLSRVTGGPTAITNVKSIQAPASFYDDVEVTALTDGVKDFLPGGAYDGGEATIEMYWTSGEANDELFDTDFLARTEGSWKIVWPSPITRTATFDAYIKSLTPAAADVSGVVMRTIVLKRTSAITWS